MIFTLTLGCMWGVSWDRGMFWWTVSSSLLGAAVLFLFVGASDIEDEDEEDEDEKKPIVVNP